MKPKMELMPIQFINTLDWCLWGLFGIAAFGCAIGTSLNSLQAVAGAVFSGAWLIAMGLIRIRILIRAETHTIEKLLLQNIPDPSNVPRSTPRPKTTP